jgi:hypothetical protein
MAKQILSQIDRPPSFMERALSSFFADTRDQALCLLRLASAGYGRARAAAEAAARLES